MSAGKSLFDKQKSECFAKLDLSRKGSIDQPILNIIEAFNQHNDYFSLSSCSGRIVVLREGGSNKDTLDTDREEENTNNGATTTTIVKSGCQWIHVAHDSVTPTEVIDLLDFDKPLDNSGSGCVVIKFEPLVLHIQCRDLDAAKLVHTASVEAGFRNSGITIGRAGKIVAAVRSTHGLEVPITNENGQMLVTKQYVEFVLNKANKKLEDNSVKITKFEEKLLFYISQEKKCEKSKKAKREFNKGRKEKGDKIKREIDNDSDIELNMFDM